MKTESDTYAILTRDEAYYFSDSSPKTGQKMKGSSKRGHDQ